MKALVLTEYKKMEYKEVPTPKITSNDEVLIKVRASAICGSDIHGYDGSTGRRKPPVIMGHEASGIVVEVGSNVTKVSINDRVTFDSTIWCGKCHFCREGRVNLCEDRRVLGVSCDDYRQDGTFAEYVVVPEHIIFPIADEVSFTEAALTEPASVASHALRITPVQLNDSIAVVGAGLIGLLVIKIAKERTSGPIIALDTDENRRKIAIEFGADAAFDPTDIHLVEQVRGVVGRHGCNRVIEAVGATKPIESAISIVANGGSITLIGNVSKSISLPLQQIVTREITLYGSCAIAGEYPLVLDMMARKKLDVTPLISKIDSLANGSKWFDTLYNREIPLLKVVLVPQED